tara:strand:- start:1278 stop:2471 length:1194 start_codon:yes stop_codon:yes gene_type:complete
MPKKARKYSKKARKYSKKARKYSKKSKRRYKKKQRGGTLTKHIMYRFMSEEDRRELYNFPDNLVYDPFTISVPFNDVSMIRSFFRLVPSIRQTISENQRVIKAEKNLKKPEKQQKLNRMIALLESEYLDNVEFVIKVNVQQAYFPIDNEGLNNLEDITIHKYLTSHAYAGVRTTHGIHGFFTYNLQPVIATRSPNFYDGYGYWDGMHQRETGGEGEGAKDIFITTFQSDELDTGDLSRGTFNNLFTNLYTEGQLEVEFKDCSEGGISAAGVNATADENFMIADEGEESVCPGFASLPEGDKIIYARLGRLMPERRREEINFRGRGKIRGYQIKMNEHVVSYDTKKTDIDKIIVYDSIVKQIMDTFNEWKNDREKRINHKNMLNTVHSQIIKYFEETM